VLRFSYIIAKVKQTTTNESTAPLRITQSVTVSFYTTFIYTFGSLILSYTGTFEPLCTLFIILSFLFMFKNEENEKPNKQELKNYFYSGIFLGLAITSHISAVLSVPFYYMFILGQQSKIKFEIKYFY
ncbi:MAG: glycosyltransferase family 39 protein, partial [Ignavibacteriales bacterium]|nr:glycosyltransferase family 39 protein [Ignavibacteriales bacterium]